MSGWTPRTVRVWQEFSHGKWRAFKTDWFGDWHLSDGDGVVFSDPYLQDVMAKAQEIDDRSQPSSSPPASAEGEG